MVRRWWFRLRAWYYTTSPALLEFLRTEGGDRTVGPVLMYGIIPAHMVRGISDTTSCTKVAHEWLRSV